MDAGLPVGGVEAGPGAGIGAAATGSVEMGVAGIGSGEVGVTEVETGLVGTSSAWTGSARTETGAGVPVRGIDAGPGARIGVAWVEEDPVRGLKADGETLGGEVVDGLLPKTRRALSVTRPLSLLNFSPNSIVVGWRRRRAAGKVGYSSAARRLIGLDQPIHYVAVLTSLDICQRTLKGQCSPSMQDMRCIHRANALNTRLILIRRATII